MTRFAFIVFLLAVAVVGAGGQERATDGKEGVMTQPFWKSPVMHGESVLFVKRPGKAVTGELLFVPTRIVEARSSSGAAAYQAGKDFVLKSGTNVITIPAGSAIPVTAAQALMPKLGSQPFDLKRRDGKGDLLFGEAHQYADMQVVFTYEHEAGDWKPAPPRFAARELPRTLRKLANGEPLSITFFGDSITVGGNASKFLNVAPFQPAYPELTVRNLERAYKSKITVKNLSVGGQTADYGLKNIDKVVADGPDLVVLAWGMNDSSGKTARPIPDFINDITHQMEAVRKAKPDTEFILVSSMLPNVDCYWTNPSDILEYRDALLRLAGKGIAVADLSSVWEELLKTKNYLDITGNGVNHPNDFGHRLYADVVSALLIAQ